MLKKEQKPKRYISVIIFIAVLLVFSVLILVPNTAAAAEFEEGTVTGTDVTVRLRPDEASPEVFKFDIGTRIGIYFGEVNGWVRVIYGNYRGYIKREYVFIPSVDTFQANVFNDGLRIRQNPGTYSTVIAELEAGTPVTIADVFGEWYLLRIEDQNIEGFAHKDFIKISSSNNASYLLKPGMKGTAVYKMQRKLKNRGFYPGDNNGKYDDLTKTAVGNFQSAAKLSVDGIAGAKTLEILYSDTKVEATATSARGIRGSVSKASWNEVKGVFTIGKEATVTDVKTGKQFKIKRYAGSLHADVDPLTSKDTAIMKDIYNSSWSWDRRAIWVTVDGITFAASMNGMPHSYNHLSGNNFAGHFCAHFYKSKGHTSGVECSIHQACVEYAYQRGNS
jgi:uncharacterized protein YraI